LQQVKVATGEPRESIREHYKEIESGDKVDLMSKVDLASKRILRGNDDKDLISWRRKILYQKDNGSVRRQKRSVEKLAKSPFLPPYSLFTREAPEGSRSTRRVI
jgi:hypothetical protein